MFNLTNAFSYTHSHLNGLENPGRISKILQNIEILFLTVFAHTVFTRISRRGAY